MKLLNQSRAGGGSERRSDHSDGEKGSTAATVTEDPAELVNIINTLAKKTQQLPDCK